MKSVVMIAYGFPPEGNAGVYRALRFVRHLPSLGWHSTVVTLDTDVYERYDPELVTMIPAGVDVVRAVNTDPTAEAHLPDETPSPTEPHFRAGE